MPTWLASVLCSATRLRRRLLVRHERHVPEPQVDDADVAGQHSLVDNERRHVLDERHVPEQHDGPDVVGQRSLIGNERRHRDGRHVPEQQVDGPGQHSLDDNERRHLSCTRAAS